MDRVGAGTGPLNSIRARADTGPMKVPSRTLSALVLVLALVIAMAAAGGQRVQRLVGVEQLVHADGGAALDAGARARTWEVSPEVTAADLQWISSAVAAARPEARRLLDAVDGLVVLHGHGAGPAGFVRPDGTRYVLSLHLPDLRAVGPKLRDHVVMHEFGHVVDFALVPQAVNAAMDQGIPRLEACHGDGVSGGCTSIEERFADTFAKWALNDAVGPVAGNLAAGYRVPPPNNLAGWAEPLAALTP